MAVRRLGQYEVLGEVGRGGMAVVHRGLDPALGRHVAIKVLHPHLSHEPESRQRFHREARAVAQLRHPNIIEIYAYSGLDSPETFLVTELIDGPDLKRFVAQHPVRLPQVAALVALPIAAALVHAHAHGIVHRDIKPENIMIQKGGVLKLTDFGIAHLIDDQMTVTGAILGSPAYMSPEHVEGGAMDGRADVFSLGTLLYTLSAGRLPFQAETPHGLLRQVLDCDAPDPRRINPLIDDELYAIVRRAMQRRPDDRYQTVDAMARDLRLYLEAEGFEEPDEALRAFLADPEGYQAALAVTLADRLKVRAREAVTKGRLLLALDLYNRVLQLDDSDEVAVAEVRRLTRRFRARRTVRRALAALVATALLALSGLWAAELVERWGADDPVRPLPAPTPAPVLTAAPDAGAAAVIATQPAPPPEPPRVLFLRAPLRRNAAFDLEDMAPRRPRFALARELTNPRPIERPNRQPPRRTSETVAVARPTEPTEPPEATEPTTIPVVIKADPPAVQISVDGVFRGVGKTPVLHLAPGRHVAQLRHPACPHCDETESGFTLDRDNPPTAPLAFRIRYRPARIVVDAPVPGRVFVGGRVAGRTAQPITIPMGEAAERSLEVSVKADGYTPWERRVTVGAGANVRLAAEMAPRD